MAVDGRTPCLIGVARRTWREPPAPEPLEMWAEVVQAAVDDARVPGGAVGAIESLAVVYCQAWQYDDACLRLAARLGAAPSRQVYSGIGGATPIRLVGEAAAAMLRGEVDLAVVAGAEALATLRHSPSPAWSFPPDEVRPFPLEIERNEAVNGIFHACLTFALLDTARRAKLGRTIAEHRRELGRLMAPLSEVAAAQPEHAWFPTVRTAEEVTTPLPANRMVSTPYTKLMTAYMDVDMAAAVLLATHDKADELGVAADRRVYLHGLGRADDPALIASRADLGRSPALAAAARAALDGLPADEVRHLDLYSCFASSLSFACDALGLPAGRQLTVTGALPYHGGPGSNYTTHAMAAMAGALRADPGSFGLVTGVGMHMTNHAAALFSTSPPRRAAVLIAVDGATQLRAVAPQAQGPGKVVTFSTMFDRQGPETTALICDLPDGSRCYARLDEPAGEEVDLLGETVSLTEGPRGATIARL
jgi:acetyl-CoA C-acetyltransferase